MRLYIFHVFLHNIPGHWVANTRAFIGNTGMREAGVIPCRARDTVKGRAHARITTATNGIIFLGH